MYRETDQMSSDFIEDQPESFTKIQNNILDALCRVRIPGEAVQVLMTIIRLTYGWQRDKWKISSGLFCRMTGVDRRNVHRAIKILEDMNIIIPDRDKYITIHRINPDTDKWLAKPKRKASAGNDDTNKHDVKNDGKFKHDINNDDIQNMTSKMTANMTSNLPLGSVKNDGKHDVKNDAHKRKKEKIKKETHKESAVPDSGADISTPEDAIKDVCVSSSSFLKTALFLCDEIRRNGVKVLRPDIDHWSKVLSEIGESPEDLEKVIAFAQESEFWRSKTLRPENFARHFETIRLQMPEPEYQQSPGNGMKEFIAGDMSWFQDPKPVQLSDSEFDAVFESIRRCQTLSELMTIWGSNPVYENYDVLTKERDTRIYMIAHRLIICSKTIEELESIFTEDEMFFTASSPRVSTLFLEKQEKLTGIPWDQEMNQSVAELRALESIEKEMEF